MSSLVFRKTESGKAEIAQRQAGLAPATRQLLILVNGVDSVQALLAKGLGDVRGHLDTLLSLRLIEPVPTPPKAASLPPAAPSPAPDVQADSSTESEDPQRLLVLQRRAYQTLQPHFGPDTPTVAQALLAARSLTGFHEALAGLEAKLSIYMGRKQAASAIESLRQMP